MNIETTNHEDQLQYKESALHLQFREMVPHYGGGEVFENVSIVPEPYFSIDSTYFVCADAYR